MFCVSKFIWKCHGCFHNFPRVDGLLFRIFKVGGLGAILKRFGVKLKAIWKNLGIKL